MKILVMREEKDILEGERDREKMNKEREREKDG